MLLFLERLPCFFLSKAKSHGNSTMFSQFCKNEFISSTELDFSKKESNAGLKPAGFANAFHTEASHKKR